MPKLLLESASALAGLALSTGTAVAVLLAPKVGTSEAPLAHFTAGQSRQNQSVADSARVKD